MALLLRRQTNERGGVIPHTFVIRSHRHALGYTSRMATCARNLTRYGNRVQHIQINIGGRRMRLCTNCDMRKHCDIEGRDTCEELHYQILKSINKEADEQEGVNG